MKKLWLLLLVAGCAKDKAPSKEPAANVPVPVSTVAAARVVEIAKAGDFDKLVADEAARARKDGLVPYLEFEASWCPPCNAIKKFLGDKEPRMTDAFAGTAIIQADLDVWQDPATKLGIEGIPTYLAIDASGHAQKDVRVGGDSWEDNVPENMAPVLKKFFREHAPR